MPEENAVACAQRVSFDDPLLTWKGCWSVEYGDGWASPWRVPLADTDLYFPTGGVGRAAMSSGVRIALRTDARSLTCEYATIPPTYDTEPPELPRADVWCNGRPHATAMLERRTDRADWVIDGLPPGENLIELWLPVYSQFRLRGFVLGSEDSLAKDVSGMPAWLHYGCSISQGRGTASPSRTFLAQVADRHGYDLMSLSMGGTCHLQPMFARLARDTPADLITAHAGTNIWYFGSLNRETLHGAVIGFVKIIRDARPDTPIVMMSPTFAPRYESKPGPNRMTHRQVREEIRSALDWLLDRGDPHLHYVDGLDLFGPEDAELLLERPGEDQIHFSADGHDLVAARLSRALVDLGIGRASGMPA